MGGLAPSTAPRAGPGSTATCWAARPWTPSGATADNPAPVNPPIPGTPPPSPRSTTAACWPTGAAPPSRWPPPWTANPIPDWPPQRPVHHRPPTVRPHPSPSGGARRSTTRPRRRPRPGRAGTGPSPGPTGQPGVRRRPDRRAARRPGALQRTDPPRPGRAPRVASNSSTADRDRAEQAQGGQARRRVHRRPTCAASRPPMIASSSIHGWRRTEIVGCRTASITTGPKSSPPVSGLTIPSPTASTGSATPAEPWPATSNDIDATIPVDRDGERAADPTTTDRRGHPAPRSRTGPGRRPSGRRPGRPAALGTPRPPGHHQGRQRRGPTTATARTDRRRADRSQRTVLAAGRASTTPRPVLAETHHRRVELGGALSDIDDALDRTRPERVQALTEAPPDHLLDLLGAPPTTPRHRPCGNTWPTWSKPTSINNYPHPPGKPSAPTSEKPENSSPTKPPQPAPHPGPQPTPGRLAAQEAIAMHRQTIQLNVHAQHIPGGPHLTSGSNRPREPRWERRSSFRARCAGRPGRLRIFWRSW